MLENQLEGMVIRSPVRMVIKFPTPGILLAMATMRRMLMKSMVVWIFRPSRQKQILGMPVRCLNKLHLKELK